MKSAIEAAISEIGVAGAAIVETRSVGGGSICDASIVTLEDGRRFFVKTHVHADR